MNKYSILLNEKKNKKSSNLDNNVGLDIENSEKMLPVDNIADTINEYNRYVYEKDNSWKYRLIFTINPYCSNVLFNTVSEPVYDEGSDHCIKFGKDGNRLDTIPLVNYQNYKGLSTTLLTRQDLIRDTGYSHPEAGGITYHCGFDIFNNHTLRQKEFTIVNKMNDDTVNRECFNTISDYVRDEKGDEVKDYIAPFDEKTGNMNITVNSNIHLYQSDTIKGFDASIDDNLTEEDGWIGFTNPTTMDIPNYGDVSLNKTMNNNKPCEIYDMYPDRSLYSFVPKLNKFRNRVENNWDYCMTYPYSNYYDNVLVQEDGVNGLSCTLVSTGVTTGDTYVFKTQVKNNLSLDDYIVLYFKSGDNYVRIENDIKVVGLGYNNEYTNYYFSVLYDDIEDYADKLKVGDKLRLRRYSNGGECRYYIRIFKRIPNFNNTEVYDDDIVSSDEIEKYCCRDFNTTINKLAFGKTIYNDNVAQIIFNDDVLLGGLKDNLGRPLTNVYLTIVKTNKGHDEWYLGGDTTSETIEYSHCFGKVTSGFDLLNERDEEMDYDVKKIHNIDVTADVCKQDYKDYDYITVNELYDINESPKNLEENEGEITITGDSNLGEGEFFGDIVELSLNDLEETVLEDVFFRFNTMQREYTENDEFRNIVYDDLTNDDYRLYDASNKKYNGSEFTVEEKVYNHYKLSDGVHAFNANLFREGYYYKAHYRLDIREFSDTVNQGTHREIKYATSSITGNILELITSVNYYLQAKSDNYKGDSVIFMKKADSSVTYCNVISVSGKLYTDVTIDITALGEDKDINNYVLFKINSEKPDYAYELNDGTGRYIWRELKSDTEIETDDELYDSYFTNGAHYFHKNINFYLRRQNPFYDDGYPTAYAKLIIASNEKDVSDYEYIDEDEENTSIC